jgi:hypothetical protein
MESCTWVFTAVPGDGYGWKYVDGRGNTLQSSHTPFRSMYECMADAEEHGYPDAVALTR